MNSGTRHLLSARDGHQLGGLLNGNDLRGHLKAKCVWGFPLGLYSTSLTIPLGERLRGARNQ